MNSYVYFLFLFFFFCNGTEDYVFKERVGNPDDTEIIERPCPVYDIECIRKYFADHSKCIKTYGPAPDPLYRSLMVIYNPRTNMTLDGISQNIRGINGRIEEFYINKDTNNLVIAIEYTNFSLAVDYNYFVFHRRAKEPVVTVAFASAFYISLTITGIIPNVEHLQLDNAEVTAYVEDAAPPTTVGPSGFASDDPQVQVAMTQFVADLSTNVQEQFLNDAPYFFEAFVQYNICDFGLLLV